jgi:ABC-type uncharacterized transport system permease subunit
MKEQSLQTRYSQGAFKERMARYFVASGGISVIIAILLIFFYLLYVVIPMFELADIRESASYIVPGEAETLHLGFHIYDAGFQSPNVEAARPLVYTISFLLVVVIVSLNITSINLRNRLREKYRALDG